jgi:hypothetical protein
MTVQTRVLAVAPAGASPLSPFGPSPQAVSSVPASIDYRDQHLDAQLRAERYRGHALRLAWAMQGLCNRAEAAGVDASYYRNLAAEVDGRLR